MDVASSLGWEAFTGFMKATRLHCVRNDLLCADTENWELEWLGG